MVGASDQGRRGPRHLLPLVRHFSRLLTPVLVALPVTPNQITSAAIAAGLAAAWCLLGGLAWSLLGCALFILCQVLDSCDGEVARIKDMRSRFGGLLDDSGDWLVHSALFVALGIRVSETGGGPFFLWCGVVAAIGVTFEYLFGLFRRSEPAPDVETPEVAASDPTGRVSPFDDQEEATWAAKAVYVLRVLVDSDFCFMLPVFVLTGLDWILLPSAAIGNQVYWASAFYENARRYHA